MAASKCSLRPIQMSIVDEHADEVRALQLTGLVPKRFVRDMGSDAGASENIAYTLGFGEAPGPIGDAHAPA